MSQDFVYEFFCRPIVDSSVMGYNPVNTLVYAAVLFGIVFFFIFPFLKKNGIKINYEFMFSLLPYVLFGAALRTFNNIGVFQKTCNFLDLNFFTFTPGIWLLTATLAIAGILAAKKLAKGSEGFYKVFGAIGTILALPLVIYLFINFKAWNGFGITIALATLLTIAVSFIVGKVRKGFFSDKFNYFVLAGQALDASSTFVATNVFKCGEELNLTAAIVGISPLLFIAIKIGIALLFIHLLDNDREYNGHAGFIKLAVVILGFAPGLHDLLALSAGMCL